MPPPLLRFAQNLLLAAVSLVLALLLMEGGVRAFHLVPANDYRAIADRAEPWRMRAHAAMVENQPEFKVPIAINGAGYRDREFAAAKTPGRTRIALIGDSFTFGTGVAASDRASDRLQALLIAAGRDGEVYNFGMAGLDTYGAIEVLEHGALPFHPDVAVLMLYLGNDVTDNARRIAARADLGAGPAAPPSFATRTVRWLQSRSQLYQFVIVRVASFPALRVIYNRMKVANLAGEVADQLEILSTREARGPLWRPTLEALRGFVALARAHGIRPVVVLLPSRLQYDDAVWNRLVAAQHLDTLAYVRDTPNRLLAPFVTDTLHADLMDPLPAYRATGAAAGSTYYPINGHFTANGQALLAEAMARAFESLPASFAP